MSLPETADRDRQQLWKLRARFSIYHRYQLTRGLYGHVQNLYSTFRRADFHWMEELEIIATINSETALLLLLENFEPKFVKVMRGFFTAGSL